MSSETRIDDGRAALARRQRATALRRLAALAASGGIGAVAGWVGQAVSGDERWFFAVPVAIVVAWWRVADPTQCAGGACAIGDARPRRD